MRDGSEATAAAARVLLILDASLRTGRVAVSDTAVTRLAYFVDAFCELWDVRPLDRFRLKQEDPRSLAVRQGLDRLVFGGIAIPESVSVTDGLRPQVGAHFELDLARARPVIDAIGLTEVGRREISLVDEVTFAASRLAGDRLSEAFRLDASLLNQALGPRDVIDLLEGAVTTSGVARRFEAGVRSGADREAQLTHLYLAHLDRMVGDA